jgi:hypothetical protein
MKRAYFLACLLLLSAGPLAAQYNPDLQKGYLPYQSYGINDFDSVNLSNGNLVLHIPILSYPQRGQVPDFKLSLIYNGKNWYQMTAQSGDYFFQIWTFNVGQGGVTPIFDSNPPGPPTLIGPNYEVEYLVPDASGAVHIMGSTGPTTMESIDASGIGYNFATSGLSYRNGISGLRDTNGNLIQHNSGAQLVWTDTVGRLIPDVSQFGFGPGCSTHNYPGPSGGTVPLTLCYSNYSIQSAFGNPNVGEYSGTVTMLSQVILVVSRNL